MVPGVKDKFRTNWYYLSFNAPEGITITVTPVFLVAVKESKEEEEARIEERKKLKLRPIFEPPPPGFDEMINDLYISKAYAAYKRDSSVKSLKKAEKDLTEKRALTECTGYDSMEDGSTGLNQ